MRAADEAVIVRELARAVAWRLDARAIFAPMLEPQSIGNGTHIHFSLRAAGGEPAMHDPAGAYQLAPAAEHFVAGVLHRMPALAALTAPSVASYYRLTPNRWAPTWTNLGYRDRGAALRICPVFAATPSDTARQFNVEYESMQNRGGLVSVATPGCGSSIASLTHRTAFGPSSPRPRAHDVPERGPAPTILHALLILP